MAIMPSGLGVLVTSAPNILVHVALQITIAAAPAILRIPYNIHRIPKFFTRLLQTERQKRTIRPILYFSAFLISTLLIERRRVMGGFADEIGRDALTWCNAI